MTIRVLVADDHHIMREGLRALLAAEPDIDLVGEAGNGRDALALATQLVPDVIVMDVAMPDMNGVEATQQIVDSLPGVRVVALSMHADKRFVRQMLGARASGYLKKGCKFEELVRAIRTVAAGRTYLCPEVADTVTQDYTRGLVGAGTSRAASLTRREREVLQLLAEGNRPKQIAARLNVSIKTVSTHRRSIMEKVGARSLADLVKYAVREGITPLDG
jgi:two-component system response regulator NreC